MVDFKFLPLYLYRSNIIKSKSRKIKGKKDYGQQLIKDLKNLKEKISINELHQNILPQQKVEERHFTYTYVLYDYAFFSV